MKNLKSEIRNWKQTRNQKLEYYNNIIISISGFGVYDLFPVYSFRFGICLQSVNSDFAFGGSNEY